MTPAQFRAALDRLDLSQGQAAEWLGKSIRQVNSYANGTPVPLAVAKLLRLCLRLELQPKDVR